MKQPVGVMSLAASPIPKGFDSQDRKLPLNLPHRPLSETLGARLSSGRRFPRHAIQLIRIPRVFRGGSPAVLRARAPLAEPHAIACQLLLLRLVGLALPRAAARLHLCRLLLCPQSGDRGRPAQSQTTAVDLDAHQPGHPRLFQVLQLLRRELRQPTQQLRPARLAAIARYRSAGGHQLLHLSEHGVHHRCLPAQAGGAPRLRRVRALRRLLPAACRWTRSSAHSAC